VVEFVICKLHPCVSVAERVLSNACFGLVGPAVAKTHALYAKSGQCIRLSVWFIGLVTPSASVISRFELLLMQKIDLSLSPMANPCNSKCVWNPGFVCTDKVDPVCGIAYAPLAITQWSWRLD